jgi:hypothetical protein
MPLPVTATASPAGEIMNIATVVGTGAYFGDGNLAISGSRNNPPGLFTMLAFSATLLALVVGVTIKEEEK